jgi:hypothetical protein
MATDRTIHHWQSYRQSKVWEHIPGDPACFVRTEPLAQGYLWQFGKQYGFADTLAEAKEWAETAREFWPRKLPSN